MSTACWDCVFQVFQEVQKSSKNALIHIQDHLERSMRQIQATQMTPGPFWTIQKRLVAFCPSNKNLATWKLFFVEGAPQFTEPRKLLWPCSASKVETIIKKNFLKLLKNFWSQTCLWLCITINTGLLEIINATMDRKLFEISSRKILFSQKVVHIVV